jgi:hypothetical protein
MNTEFEKKNIIGGRECHEHHVCSVRYHYRFKNEIGNALYAQEMHAKY